MISIVIPTCKSENLVPCLESINKYTMGAEIIVVCNGYDSDLPHRCKSIYFPDKIGYPRAINAGIREATGDFIVLLNDDTVLLPQRTNDWLQILSAPFSEPSVGITGPWMMHNTEIDREFLCFFCCMIRRAVLDKVGLLDESFGAGYAEDVDLCCKAQDAGFRMVQVPVPDKLPYDGQFGYGAFPIYHAGNQTFKNWEGGVELLSRNHAILRERYGGAYIENAKKLGEWMSDEELLWLGRKARRSDVVIEIGSWFGKSSMAIADNLKEGGVLYCVDTWAGSAAEKETNHIQAKDMDGDFAYNEFIRNNWRHIESGKLRPIRMHGRHAATFFKDMGVKADLIFIDAGHTYEEVKEDIFAFAPLMKEGGIISGHDYGNVPQGFEPWPGVKQAVDEVFGGNFSPVLKTTIWATDCNPLILHRDVYECIMFNNEFDMLEKQLTTMWDVVDRFVVVEATVNHAGKPKPLHFRDNLERFRPWLSKISHIIVEDSPPMNGSEEGAWNIERHQRDAIMRALTQCKDNDTIIVVDCDEIPNPDSVKMFHGELSALSMDLYLYDYRVKAVDKWRHGKIMPYWQLKQIGPNPARYATNIPDIEPGGEHLSYFGGIEAIQEKIRNTAHRNIDIPEFNNPAWIEHCISKGKDLFNRDIKYEVIA